MEKKRTSSGTHKSAYSRYGDVNPPSYDLSKIKKDIYLAYGNNDRYIT